MRVAMISPAKDSYSETFIQAQKLALDNVLFYYGGALPVYAEGKAKLLSKPESYLYKLKRYIKLTTFSDAEQALKKSFLKNEIKVVFAHYGTTAIRILNVCQFLNLPLVVHFHGYDISKKEILNKFHSEYIEIFKYAFKIIAVSNEMINDLMKLGCPKEKIVYSPCTPEDDYYKIEPNYNSLNVLAIGRFTEKKAPDITIKAFAKVCKELPEAKLYMAGEGKEKEKCVKLVNELGLEDRVYFLGAINKSEIIQRMEDSRVFIQHSVTAKSGDKEGTPVALLEASLAGLPIIATRHAGINDIVTHEETGLLCDEYDIDAYSLNLCRVLQSSELASVMGRAGRIRVKKKFNRSKQMEKLQKLINTADEYRLLNLNKNQID